MTKSRLNVETALKIKLLDKDFLLDVKNSLIFAKETLLEKLHFLCLARSYKQLLIYLKVITKKFTSESLLSYYLKTTEYISFFLL